MQINGGFETSIILISTPPFWEGQMPIAHSDWVGDIQMRNYDL
jgi:hypothetical protein